MPIPHDEFVERLHSLFSALKIKGWKKHTETVTILLQDNISLKKQLKERSDEQRNTEEGK